MRLSRWFVAMFVPGILLLGCAPGAGGGTNPVQVAGSRAKIYHSIQELNADSIAVIRLTATGTRTVEQSAAVPYTVTAVKVNQVLRGTIDGSTIKLRQMGSSNSSTMIEDVVPLVQPGQSYVAFLMRFTYGPGRDTDQYIPVGAGAGLFLDQAGRLQRLDSTSRDIPVTLSLTDVQRQLAS